MKTYIISEETLNDIIAECMNRGNTIGGINILRHLDKVEKIDLDQEINNTKEYYKLMSQQYELK